MHKSVRTVFLLAGFVSLAGGCDGEWGGIVLDVSYEIVKDTKGTMEGRIGWSILGTSVKVTNVGSSPVVVETGGCPSLHLQAYATPDRSGAPAWTDHEFPVVFCRPGTHLVLAPGATRELGFGAQIPADWAGTYYMSAALELVSPRIVARRFDAGTLEVPAGGG
ncbi:MAG TPA: hypothetical protein VGA37_09110 [Gemmatimonadales bacterium]